MNSLLRLMLVAAALLAMVAGATASAMAPLRSTAPMAAMQGMKAMTDCTGAPAKAEPGAVPCKSLSLQCLADMGCATAAAIQPNAAGLEPVHRVMASPVSSLAPPLASLSSAPDPDPPSRLS